MVKTLLSLNSQSMPPSEVVVTDDGSDKDMLGELKLINPELNYKVKYVRQENNGFRAAKARNNGVRYSENEYLVFYDQDIVSTKNYLRTFAEYADLMRFIVAYPVRLTESQTNTVDKEMISAFKYDHILMSSQVHKVKKQFLKDYYSFVKNKLGLSKKGPKLRSGVFALHKENFVKVNGFDELYRGWGNEDDDLGNRLYASGLVGFNPFWNEYPLHLYHEANHQGGTRVNAEYYSEKKKIIKEGNFTCDYGLSNPLGNEKIDLVEFDKL